MRNKILFLGLGMLVGAIAAYYLTKRRTERNAIQAYVAGTAELDKTCQTGYSYDDVLGCIEDAEEVPTA